MNESKLKKVIFLTLSMGILIITSIIFMTYANPDDVKTHEEVVQWSIEQVLENSFSQHYKINSIDVSVNKVDVKNQTMEAGAFVKMNTTLKAKKPEELPYVKGMLRRVNLSDFTYESEAKTKEAITEANAGKFEKEKLTEISEEINFRIKDLQQYIGKADDHNFFIKVTASMDDNSIVEDSIKLFAENIDEYIPIEQMLPKSSAEMEQQGFNDMQAMIDP